MINMDRITKSNQLSCIIVIRTCRTNSRSGRIIYNISPTQTALIQHSNRPAYQDNSNKSPKTAFQLQKTQLFNINKLEVSHCKYNCICVILSTVNNFFNKKVSASIMSNGSHHAQFIMIKYKQPFNNLSQILNINLELSFPGGFYKTE